MGKILMLVIIKNFELPTFICRFVILHSIKINLHEENYGNFNIQK